VQEEDARLGENSRGNLSRSRLQRAEETSYLGNLGFPEPPMQKIILLVFLLRFTHIVDITTRGPFEMAA